MGFVVNLFIWAGLWILSYSMRKSMAEEVPSQTVEDVPRTVEGEAVPFVFGRMLVTAPNVIWYGNAETIQRTYSGDLQTYCYAAIMFGICKSNINIEEGTNDAEARLCDYGILADETRPTAGSWIDRTSDYTEPPGTSVYGVNISLGESPPAGVLAEAEFCSGRWDADVGAIANISYVAAGLDTAFVPPYQGTVTCMVSSGGGIAAVSPGRAWFGANLHLPRIAFEVINPCAIPGVGQALLEYTNGDANPAAVLYTILTQGWGGLKIDPAKIDVSTFEDAAIVLFVEQNGMSGVIYRGETAEALTAKILDQMEAVLYEDPQTLLLTLKLIREDYDPNTLDELDLSAVTTKPEFSRTTYAQTRNLVRVRFKDRDKEYRDDEVFESDPANYEQSGVVRDETYDMPFVTNRVLASKIAVRTLHAQALPLAKVKFGAKRSTVFWTPGKVFKYTHPSNGKTFIMRVMRVDVGANSEEVVIDAIQDRWSYSTVVTQPPDVIGPTPPTPPLGPFDDTALETPRFILRRGTSLGLFGDDNGGRIMYLAAPTDDTPGYHGRLDIVGDASPELVDTINARFTGTARLASDVAREDEPELTQMAIDNLQNWDLENYDDIYLRIYGYNLVQVGDGPDAEIMGFLSSQEVMEIPGRYNLLTVYRGLLDTVPRAHVEGEPVYHLDLTTAIDPVSVFSRIGRYVMTEGQEAEARLFLYRSGITPAEEDVDASPLTVRQRPILPYPVADMLVNDAKEIGTVQAEGLHLEWKRRDRLADTITLGVDDDETVSEADVTYTIFAQKDGDGEVAVVEGLTGVERWLTPAAAAGHGDITLAIRTIREDVIGGTTLSRTSWQDPAIAGTFKPWRNLLLNPAHIAVDGDAFAGWETLDGTPVVTEGGGPYAGMGRVIGTNGDDPTEWHQRVRVTGYRPKRMRAVANFKMKGIPDTSDTVTAVLQSLDVDNATVDSDTITSEVATSTWEEKELEILNLGTDTDRLDVQISQYDVGGDPPDGTPQGAVCDFRLRLGQFTDQLFDMSLNATTGWTTSAGSFTTGSSNPARGAAYVQGGANATNTMWREGNIPAGYNFGECVVEVGTRYAGPGIFGGTITVTVEARVSSGGSVVATASGTGLGLDSAWWRTRVVCSVPRTATVIRVTLSSTTASGTANQVQWNDGDIRIHKYLDPQHELTYDFSEPPSQKLPRSPYRWAVEHPSVAVPSYGMFNGTLTGALGTEPMMRAMSGAYLARVNLPEPHAAYEFREGSGAVVHARNNASYANFTSSQSFTVRVAFTAHTALNAFGLCGRLGATGWSIDVTGGSLRVRLVGTGGTVSLTGALRRYGPTFVALVYDHGAQTLRIVTPDGTTSTSTAAIGEFACGEIIPFCIGDHTITAATPMTGTISSVDLWSTAIGHAALQSLWVWGANYWGGASVAESPATNSPVACVVGYDDAGNELLGEFHQGAEGTWAYVNGYRGLPSSKSRNNNVNSPNPNTTNSWSTVGAATVTLNAAIAPNGRWEAVRIAGGNNTGRSMDALPTPLDPASPLNVSFMARSIAPGTAYFRAYEPDGTTPACDPVPFSVSTTWQRVDLQQIELYPGTAAESVRWLLDPFTAILDIAGPIWLDQDADNPTPPVAIPTVGMDAQSTTTVEALDLDLQHNHEGEIEIRCLQRWPDLEAGTFAYLIAPGSDERHRLYSASLQTLFMHRDGAGAEVHSEVSDLDDWSTERVVRGRWNRAGLLDAASAFAGVVSDSGQDFDRTAIWTPGTIPFDTLAIGHDTSGADAFNGIITRLTVRSREKILPAVL